MGQTPVTEEKYCQADELEILELGAANTFLQFCYMYFAVVDPSEHHPNPLL